MERRPPCSPEPVIVLARQLRIDLPSDYISFLRSCNGARGPIGETWLEIWPVTEVETVAAGPVRYEGVLLFAGDGANTVYGFDATQDGRIVEGDWIGLNRDELIDRGQTLTAFLCSLASET
jgi:hypothetical protein